MGSIAEKLLTDLFFLVNAAQIGFHIFGHFHGSFSDHI